MPPQHLWHEPPNSTSQVRKFNHRSGRYAVWGRQHDGREEWDVMDGQGDEKGTSIRVGGPFASRDEAINEAERLIRENERTRPVEDD